MRVNIRRRDSLFGIVLLCLLVPSAANAAVTAMLDTGIDPNVLKGVTVPGFDFIRNDPVPDDESDNRHGTQMAIIFNGVARGEQIMPLKVWKPYSLVRGNAAMDMIKADPNVNVITINSLQPLDINRMIEATSSKSENNKVIVVNAGNFGGSSPHGTARGVASLGGAGLIVGALSSNGQIAGSSNRAGGFKDHYLTASGSSPVSSDFGTSFSSARVAAGAALLKTRDPHLNNRQIVEILLRTADDQGAPGVDTVYGYGSLNVGQAMLAQGDSSLATGSDSGGGGAAVAAGALLIGVGAYALSKKNKSLENALILDEYGRSFHINLNEAVTHRSSITTMPSLFAALDYRSGNMLIARSRSSSLYGEVNVNGASDYYAYKDTFHDNAWDYEEQNVGFSLHSYEKSGNRHSMGLNSSQKAYFGALSLVSDSHEAPRFLTSEPFSAPFMGFTDRGISTASKLQYGQNLSMKFGLSALDDKQKFGVSSESVFFESSYSTDKWGLSFQLGQLEENGNLYGGASGGGFSVDSASTLSLGFSGEYNLSAKSALIGSYTLGLTDVDDRENSLLHNFSTLRSNSWGVGYLTKSLLNKGDALGVAYFQPLRVSSGEVDTDVPYERDIEGNIYNRSGRYSLVPDGTESVFEMYYKFNVGKRSALTTHLLYRDQPFHDRDADAEKAIMLTFQRYSH
jgi:hypothetical protein